MRRPTWPLAFPVLLALAVAGWGAQNQGIDLDQPFAKPWWLDGVHVDVPPAKLTEKKFGGLVVLNEIEDLRKGYLSHPERFREVIKLATLVFDANPDAPWHQQAAMTLGLYYEGLMGDLPRANHFYRLAYEQGGNATLRDAPTHGPRPIKNWALVAQARLHAKAGQDAAATRLLASGSFTDWRDLIEVARVYQTIGDVKRSTAATIAALAQAPRDNPFQKVLALGRGVVLLCENGEEEAARRYLAQIPPTVQALKPEARTQADVVAVPRAAQEAINALSTERKVDLAKVPDGLYHGTAYAYSGPVTVAVEVRGGKIVSVKVQEHVEKRPLEAIDQVPERILKSQRPFVDGITGATITSLAVGRATLAALTRRPK